MKNVYLVVFDGYMGGYGSEIYLLGIYDTENKAEEALEKLLRDYPELTEQCGLKEIRLNNTFEAVPNDWLDAILTDVCLGGYIE